MWKKIYLKVIHYKDVRIIVESYKLNDKQRCTSFFSRSSYIITSRSKPESKNNVESRLASYLLSWLPIVRGLFNAGGQEVKISALDSREQARYIYFNSYWERTGCSQCGYNQYREPTHSLVSALEPLISHGDVVLVFFLDFSRKFRGGYQDSCTYTYACNMWMYEWESAKTTDETPKRHSAPLQRVTSV